MQKTLLSLLEDVADSTSWYLHWFEWIGIVAFVSMLFLLESKLKVYGMFGGVVLIWCFGIYLFVYLFRRSRNPYGVDEDLGTSMVGDGKIWQQVLFTYFVLIWFLGLGSLTSIFIFKLVS